MYMIPRAAAAAIIAKIQKKIYRFRFMMLVLGYCFTLRYQHLLEIRIRFFYVNHLMMSSKRAFSLCRLPAESGMNGERRFYIYIVR